jgi:hypothetical protein
MSQKRRAEIKYVDEDLAQEYSEKFENIFLEAEPIVF